MQDRYVAAKIILDAYFKNTKDALEVPAVDLDEHPLGSMLEYMVHKVKHTFEVSQCMEDILHNERLGLTAHQRNLAILSAILHDLGRFYQHKDGRILSSREFNHGAVSVELLKRDGRFTDPGLLYAIDQHDDALIDASLAPSDFAITLARLLRDADKLANVRVFSLYGSKYMREDNRGMSSKVKDAMMSGRLVIYKDCITPADQVAAAMAWFYDINYPYTKRQVISLGYFRRAFDELRRFGTTLTDMKDIRKSLGLAGYVKIPG